jgi:hypothetical protein
MELITILNRCHRFRGFVYQHACFSADKKSIEVAVRPRKGSAAVCWRCHLPEPGYDRRFEFIPLWGFLVFLLYTMRRVNCRRCGIVAVEEPPRLAHARGGFAPGTHGSATHVSKVLYAFVHLDGSRTWTDSDRQVADAMSSHWVNFARTGDPNGNGLTKWPVYDGKNQSVMVFGDPAQGAQTPSEAQLAFFQSYFDKLTAR